MNKPEERPNTAAIILAFGPLVYGFYNAAPVIEHGRINWISGLLGFFALLCLMHLLCVSLDVLARLVDWRRANTPKGQKGRAKFASWRDIKDEMD